MRVFLVQINVNHATHITINVVHVLRVNLEHCQAHLVFALQDIMTIPLSYNVKVKLYKIIKNVTQHVIRVQVLVLVSVLHVLAQISEHNQVLLASVCLVMVYQKLKLTYVLVMIILILIKIACHSSC